MEEIINLYERFGNSEYLGESVSKTTHMIQAATAAKNSNEPDFLILACLLHDIGHFLDIDDMGGLGVIEHGMVGANFLRKLGMNERVCKLVENHVRAKKYLVSKKEDYYNKLSEASKKTLEFQGGKMSESEMILFEQEYDFENSLKVRHYDDIGKQIGMDIPELESFFLLIKKYLEDRHDINYYNKMLVNDGFLLLKNFFSEDEKIQIIKFREQLEQLPEKKGKWMTYFEEKNNNRKKSRIENFYNYNENIKKFIDSKINPFLNKICKSEMVLFKEKINWKLSKADGFKAHQDHPAWDDFNISRFYSAAIFCNDCVKENGCLEVVRGKNNLGPFQKEGCIPPEIENSFNWEYLETSPYDLLIFDSYMPHRSGKNNSLNSRSIMYFTFNKLEEGYFYSEYIEKKRKYFPPHIERDEKIVSIENNKYNLGNPLK